jgi:two-component system nitrogen regulation response regulator NtrX
LKDSIKRYELIGESPAMIRVKREIERVGPADKTVMLIGESGSGKEMAARQIHYHSPSGINNSYKLIAEI